VCLDGGHADRNIRQGLLPDCVGALLDADGAVDVSDDQAVVAVVENVICADAV